MARKMPAKSVELDANVRVLAVHGPEDAIKKDKIDQLRAALEKEHGEVQRFSFDGKVASLAEVFDEVRGYSLMGGYKLVIVDPADDFVKAHREPLERYAQNPVDHATLVLRAVGWNRGNLDKHIAKVGAVIKCEPPKPAEAVSRLVARAKDVHGMSIDRPAAQLMVDRLGVHLVRLETELDKLAAMAGALSPKGRSMKSAGGIDRAMVEQAVGKSSDEKAWEVQESILAAMGSRQASGGASGGQIVTKVRELIDLGGQPEILVMYFVADLARKLAVGGQMRAAGEPEGAIGKALKLWGPRQRLFMDVLRKVGPDGGARLLDLALSADARSKSGFGPAGRNLEGLCVQMADVQG